MGEPEDKARSWMSSLRQRRPVALLLFVVAVAAGLAGFIDSVSKISDRLQLITAKPRIVAFSLSPAAVGFNEEQLPSLTHLSLDDLRSFASDDDAPGHRAVFIITIENPLRADLILTELTFDVVAIGFYAGVGGAGPLDALTTYHHTLRFETGRQLRPLVPPFQVPAASAASFDLAISPYRPAAFPTDTPVWIMTIGLAGGGYTLKTDRFQLLMSIGGGKDANPASDDGAR